MFCLKVSSTKHGCQAPCVSMASSRNLPHLRGRKCDLLVERPEAQCLSHWYQTVMHYLFSNERNQIKTFEYIPPVILFIPASNIFLQSHLHITSWCVKYLTSHLQHLRFPGQLGANLLALRNKFFFRILASFCIYADFAPTLRPQGPCVLSFVIKSDFLFGSLIHKYPSSLKYLFCIVTILGNVQLWLCLNKILEETCCISKCTLAYTHKLLFELDHRANRKKYYWHMIVTTKTCKWHRSWMILSVQVFWLKTFSPTSNTWKRSFIFWLRTNSYRPRFSPCYPIFMLLIWNAMETKHM